MQCDPAHLGKVAQQTIDFNQSAAPLPLERVNKEKGGLKQRRKPEEVFFFMCHGIIDIIYFYYGAKWPFVCFAWSVTVLCFNGGNIVSMNSK